MTQTAADVMNGVAKAFEGVEGAGGITE